MIVKFVPESNKAIIEFEDSSEYSEFYTILDNISNCEWNIKLIKEGEDKDA